MGQQGICNTAAGTAQRDGFRPGDMIGLPQGVFKFAPGYIQHTGFLRETGTQPVMLKLHSRQKSLPIAGRRRIVRGGRCRRKRRRVGRRQSQRQVRVRRAEEDDRCRGCPGGCRGVCFAVDAQTIGGKQSALPSGNQFALGKIIFSQRKQQQGGGTKYQSRQQSKQPPMLPIRSLRPGEQSS